MDILNEYFFGQYIYIQWLPVFFGFVAWSRLESIYKIFVIILLYSVLNEMFKIYYGTYIHIGYNRIWTNVYNVIYFLTLFWLFNKNSKSQKEKLFITIYAIIYGLSVLYELLILKVNYHYESQVIPYIFGGAGVLLFTFHYLLGLLNSEESINIFKSMMFWIVIAHFFYYLGFTPFKIGENYFASFEKYRHLFIVKVYITFLKCIILSIGFIWSRQSRPLLSSS